jgi:hypothetical protein
MLATGYLYLGKLLTFEIAAAWKRMKAIPPGFPSVGKKGILGCPTEEVAKGY